MPTLRSVYLIHCIEQYNFLNNDNFPKDFVTDDYMLYEKLQNKIGYLYKPIDSDNDNDAINIQNAVFNWYKDESGNDLILIKGISVGPIIARRVMASFVNDYRNYLALSALLKNYDTIFLDKNSPISYLRVANILKNKIQWYFASYPSCYTNTSSPIRATMGNFPNVHKLSFLARIIQKPLLPFLKKKTLVWFDWTYNEKFSKNDRCLTYYNFNPLRGYYFCLNGGAKYKLEAEIVFPKDILEVSINTERMLHRIGKINKWSPIIVELFKSTIREVYNDSHQVLRRTYTIYKELLSFYQPKLIIVPGSTHFAHLIALQISKTMNIKTMFVLDGYDFIKDESAHFPLHNSNQTLFDYYCVFGKFGKDLHLKYNHISSKQILVCKSPLVEKINYQIDDPKNSIVLAYFIHHHNPNSRWDKGISITFGAVDLLIESGCKNVIIKIKDGSDVNDIDLYKQYINENYHDINVSLTIATGEFNKIVHTAKIIIGQISTALFESICAKVPYIIYEPYEAGVTDAHINSSPILSLDNVARNTQQLKRFIESDESSLLFKRDYLIDGMDLNDLNL